MKCAHCGRSINPAHAHTSHDRRTYGPVCSVRLGLTQPKRRQSVTRASHVSHVVRVDENQPDFFEMEI